MRRYHAVSSAAVLVGLLACQATVEVTTDRESDIAAINAVRHAEAAAVVTGDTVLAYAADDVVLMPPGEPRVVGIDAARAWAVATRGEMTIHLITYDQPTIEVRGDWATERYTGLVLMSPADGGPMMTSAMKGVHVYRRGVDGWKMAMDIWNSDAAM
jgi:ketosteroid isomerase-like protein